MYKKIYAHSHYTMEHLESMAKNAVRDFGRVLRRAQFTPLEVAVYSTVTAYIFFKNRSDRKTGSEMQVMYENLLHGELNLDLSEAITGKVLSIVEKIGYTTWETLRDQANQYQVPESLAMTVLEVDFNKIPMDGKYEETPLSIIKLASEILDVGVGDRVLNFYSGVDSFVKYQALMGKNAHYSIWNEDDNFQLVNILRAKVLQCAAVVSLKNMNQCFDVSVPEQYDVIFANYPLKKNLLIEDRSNIFWIPFLQTGKKLERISSEWIFNECIVNMLSEKGRAVVIISNGTLSNKNDAPFRKRLVDAGLVEAVIALPARMFTRTAIDLSLVVLSKAENNYVRFVNATGLGQLNPRSVEFSEADIDTIVVNLQKEGIYSKNIELKRLQENEYILNYSRYFTEHLSFDNGRKLGDIMALKRGVPLSANMLDALVANEPTNIKLLTNSNIHNGMVLGELISFKELDKKIVRYVLQNHDLVIAKSMSLGNAPYKFVVIDLEELKDEQICQGDLQILPSANMFVLELNESLVDPYYLQAFLESEQGNACLKSITVGTAVATFKVDDLKNLEIPLPSMAVQKKIGREYKEAQNRVKRLKKKLVQALDDLQSVYVKNI